MSVLSPVFCNYRDSNQSVPRISNDIVEVKLEKKSVKEKHSLSFQGLWVGIAVTTYMY